MSISFQNIPSDWRVPLYWVELDNSQAGFPYTRMPALMVGTMTTKNTDTKWNGTATPDVPILIGRQQDANSLFGQGSELAQMFEAFFANNLTQQIYGLPVAESAASVQASGTITVNSVPTQAGTLHLYIAGVDVPVNIPADATITVNEIASNIADAINANPDLPVTATSAAAVCTVACKWGGINGNEITIADSLAGLVGGQQVPVGMTITYSGFQLSGGVGAPDFTNALANLGENPYEYVALPYTDSTTLLGWETEFGFSDGGRWGWMRQLYGLLYSAKRDTYSNLVTFGDSRNSPVTTVMAIEPLMPSPSYKVAAAYAAKAARALSIDPARPLQTLHLEGIMAAPLQDRFNLGETNTLAWNGLATQRTFDDQIPQISRETTTYQLNLYGQLDDSYELVTTMATLSKLIRNQRYAITSKYPRHKLADDGTKFAAGQAIVTPTIIKAELVAEYAIDEFNGLVENMADYKANLIVERDSNDPNRVNVLYPPDLINQLRMFAVLNQFRLQYNRGLDAASLQ